MQICAAKGQGKKRAAQQASQMQVMITDSCSWCNDSMPSYAALHVIPSRSMTQVCAPYHVTEICALEAAMHIRYGSVASCSNITGVQDRVVQRQSGVKIETEFLAFWA